MSTSTLPAADARPGLPEEGLEDFRRRVRAVIASDLASGVVEAERMRRFPREAVAALGAGGIFRERWQGGAHGDMERAAAFAEEIGRSGIGGVGIGVSLHLEAFTSILRRYARSPLLNERLDEALDGSIVGCVAASEQHGGSDLSAVKTTMSRSGSGWRVRGSKWFVSPGAAADCVLVLARAESGRSESARRHLPPLALVLVPSDQVRVAKVLETAGARGLATARLEIDATVEDDALVSAPGEGLAAVTWGLTHERFAIAAGALGAASLAVGLARTHAARRTQFGQQLFEHQALRLRLAELQAQLDLALRGVHALAADISRGASAIRAAAGAKVVAARLAEHAISESLHVFGGSGYVEDETPLARMLRDVRIARLGAGTDEIMWEIVAGGMRPADEIYDRLIG